MGRLGPLADPHGVAPVGQLVAEVVVVDDPPHGQEQLAVGLVAEPAAAQDAGLADRPAALVDDHRGPDGEGFEDDVAERLGEQRGDDHGPGPVEQPGQRRAAEQPLELDVGHVGGQRRGARPRKGPVPAIRRSTSGRSRIRGISRWNPFIRTSRPAAAR